MNAIDYLRSLGACGGAMEWVLSRPKERQTLEALWEDCERAEWMLWLARRQPQPDLAGIVAAAHAFAMLAHDYATGAGSTAAAYAAAAADYAALAAALAAARAADYAARAAGAAAGRAEDSRTLCRRQCADMVRLLVRRPEVPRATGGAAAALRDGGRT